MALTLSTVEVLSRSTLIVGFSEPLSTATSNYEAATYSIPGLTIRSVLKPLVTGAPVEVVLVTDNMPEGTSYVLSATGLESASTDEFDDTAVLAFTSRQTKLDKVLEESPTLYDTAPDSTIRQVLTAIHRENDKIGGNEDTLIVPTIPTIFNPELDLSIAAFFANDTGNPQSELNLANEDMLISGNSLTVEMWIRPTTSSSSQRPTFNVRNTLGRYNFGFGLSNTTDIGFRYSPSSGTTRNHASDSLVETLVDTWNHIAVTRDFVTGITTFFINGVLKNALTPQDAGTPLFTTGTFETHVGTQGSSSTDWVGYLADLRLWSVIRTDEEILANYNIALAGTEVGLVSYHKLTSDFNDLTANANHLTPDAGAGVLPVIETVV